MEAFDEKRHTQLGQSKAIGWVIVQTLMFFLFVFLKNVNMLSQCLVPSITKKVISYLLTLGQPPLTALQIQNFQYSVSTYVKTIRNFFFT